MMDPQLEQASNRGERGEASAGNVSAETVNITQGTAGNIEATTVTVRQGGVQSLSATNAVVRQGGVLTAKTDTLEVLQGGVLLAQAKNATLTASRAALVLAQGDVKVDQGAARVLVSAGDVTVDQGASLVMMAPSIQATNSQTVLLLAGKVQGTVDAVFDVRASLALAAVAGAAAGLVVVLANRLRR